ncbi:MAG: 23S rRNA (adenine(2503)-C(2))-methyltransferase RlmN [Clostridia bacterium]|nr:23S rRNA (adenine(2503)-C(2))-methyltransferase RlmN [Clostridia bacterium]
MKFLQDLTFTELSKLLKDFGQPAYRAAQLFKWISQGALYGEMTNVPKSLIDRLIEEGYSDSPIKIIDTFTSKIDGTIKLLYALYDGNVIEGVLMKYKYGNTLCVSTQVGCRMNCAFCASGLDGLIRNLSCGEIIGQIIVVNRLFGNVRAVTNVVLMGSGEPLDNYDETAKFLTAISDDNGLNISKRNISLSTCGLCDKIRKLCDDGYTPTLTISLHAPSDEIRSKIMPVSHRYPISELISAAKYYFDVTGRRVIFEYSMIDNVNDSKDCAYQLAKITKGMSCHINLIRLNTVKERGMRGASDAKVKAFLKILSDKGVSATIRRTLGSDIEGACGQLRRRYLGEVDNV